MLTCHLWGVDTQLRFSSQSCFIGSQERPLTGLTTASCWILRHGCSSRESARVHRWFSWRQACSALTVPPKGVARGMRRGSGAACPLSCLSLLFSHLLPFLTLPLKWLLIHKCLFVCLSISPVRLCTRDVAVNKQLTTWPLHSVICCWAFRFPGFCCQVLMPSDILLSRNNSIDFWHGSHPLMNELGGNAGLRHGGRPFPSESLSCGGHWGTPWG